MLRRYYNYNLLTKGILYVIIIHSLGVINILEYNKRRYSITKIVKYEHELFFDLEIVFKCKKSKISFLNSYTNNKDCINGKYAVIDGYPFNECYFYDITSSKKTIKAHVKRR